MPFAQLVIGPPGAGKSTYCHGMHQFLGAIGRKSSIVNLDPANDPPRDSPTYTPALDIRDLISLEHIMQDEEIGLGPNGGVLYAMEELEMDLLSEEEKGSWFREGLKALGEDYVLFDCPGQVEIFTHHGSLRRVVAALEKMGYRVCPCHLLSLLPNPQILLMLKTRKGNFANLLCGKNSLSWST